MGAIVEVRGPKVKNPVQVAIEGSRAVAFLPYDFGEDEYLSLFNLCKDVGVEFSGSRDKVHLEITSRLPAGPATIIRAFSCLCSWVIDPSPEGHHEFTKPDLKMLLQGKPPALIVS